MSLFSALNIGVRGLNASQLGMNITGQNITNSNVEGYSRKRINAAADYRFHDQYGQIGFGVEIISIDRMRNEFLDKQIRQQNESVGTYKEINYALENIENIFTEPGETGIMTYIDKFFDSWENLTSNPADIAARTMVKTNGEILTNVFHNISIELRDLRSTRNDEMQSRIENINVLTSKILNLNNEIATVEIGSQNANDSRDKRDLLLKTLSSLIEINTIENDVGQVTVTTSGNIIVSPIDTQELELTTVGGTYPDGSTYNDIGIRFKDSRRVYNPTGGELKGLVEARDVYIPEYIDWIDSIAQDLVRSVNQQHLLGYNLMGYNGFNFFDPQTTGAYDIKLSDSILSDVKNIAAALANQSTPATANTVALGALNFGNIYQLTEDGFVSTGPADPENVNNIVQGTVVVSIGGTALIENVDYSVNYINGTVQMLHNGYDNNVVVVNYDYNTGNFSGPGDNENAILISQLRHQLTMDPAATGNYTATFDQFYSSVIGRLGFQRNEAASNLETREYLVNQYEMTQDSIAGVSIDEEMANLIQYQHTYQASARIIATANLMLDTLMNL